MPRDSKNLMVMAGKVQWWSAASSPLNQWQSTWHICQCCGSRRKALGKHPLHLKIILEIYILYQEFDNLSLQHRNPAVTSDSSYYITSCSFCLLDFQVLCFQPSVYHIYLPQFNCLGAWKFKKYSKCWTESRKKSSQSVQIFLVVPLISSALHLEVISYNCNRWDSSYV